MTATTPKASKTAPVTAPAPYGRITTQTGNRLYFPTNKLKLITGLLKAGKPVALIGEPGSGKTELARAILFQALAAHATKTGEATAFFQQEFGGIVSGDMLDGEKTIGDGGKLEIIPSEHLKAVRSASKGVRTGEVLDEVNRGSAQGVNKLLRQYAQNEYSSDLDGVLTYNPVDLMTIATLNVGFGFSGTSRMDAALIDRFYPVLLTPPPVDVLSDILDERYGTDIDPKVKDAILKAYDKSRASDDGYKMGVRDVQMLADGVVHGGLTVRESVEILVGGKVQMNGMDESSMESLITVVSAA